MKPNKHVNGFQRVKSARYEGHFSQSNKLSFSDFVSFGRHERRNASFLGRVFLLFGLQNKREERNLKCWSHGKKCFFSKRKESMRKHILQLKDTNSLILRKNIFYTCMHSIRVFVSFKKYITFFLFTFTSTKQFNNHLIFYSLSVLQESFLLLSSFQFSLFIQTQPQHA